MITATGAQMLAARIARQRLIEIPPATWQEWHRGINLHAPHATDDTLTALADWLFTYDGYITTSTLIKWLNGELRDPRAEALAADQLAQVETTENGGKLIPDDANMTANQWLQWLRAAIAYAKKPHQGMTPRQINQAAREHAYHTIGLERPKHALEQPRNIHELTRHALHTPTPPPQHARKGV